MFQGLHHFKVADSYIAESNISLKYPDFNDLLGKKIPQYNYNQHTLSHISHSDQITILTIIQLNLRSLISLAKLNKLIV